MEKINNKIRIHHITSPSFKYGDKTHYVESRMLRNFSDIDDLIQVRIKQAEKRNIKLEMAILNLYNMYDGKPNMAVTGEYILWIRFKFFESIDGELPINLEVSK